jgi:hypothetical protein
MRAFVFFLFLHIRISLSYLALCFPFDILCNQKMLQEANSKAASLQNHQQKNVDSIFRRENNGNPLLDLFR